MGTTKGKRSIFSSIVVVQKFIVIINLIIIISHNFRRNEKLGLMFRIGVHDLDRSRSFLFF